MKTQLGSRACWTIRSARVGVALAAALLAGTASAQSVPDAQPAPSAEPAPSAQPATSAQPAPDLMPQQAPPATSAGGDGSDLLLPQLPPPTTEPSAEAVAEAEQPPADDTKPGKKKKKKAWKPHPPRTPQMEAEIRQYDDRLATMQSASRAQVAGFGIFTIAYVPSLLVGGLAAEMNAKKWEPLRWLALPAAGPLITMATMDVDDMMRALFIADGVIQTIGLATAIIGTAVKSNANSQMMRSSRAPGPNVALQVAPVVSPTTGGLAISGSF